MPTIRITGIDDNLYGEIKRAAVAENCSVSQQVLFMLKDYLAKRQLLSRAKTSAQVLLELSDSWEDERSADQIIAEIKASRFCRKA